MLVKIIFAWLLAGSMLFGATSAHADQFTLGRTIVIKGSKDAVIPVPVCRRAKSIRVKAEKGMFLSRVKVKFHGGGSRTFHFNHGMKENQKTSWRKFSYTRCVDSLEVFGTPYGSKAGVRVYGRNW